MYLKFVSERRKLKHDSSSFCCCGARIPADAAALLSIMRLIISTIQVQPIPADPESAPAFLEIDSVNGGRETVAPLPQPAPACEHIRNYMSMSAQMLRAHASAKTLSSSLAVSDKPPLPGTTSMVF